MTVGCSKEKWTLTVGPYNDFLSNGGELEVSSAALDAHDGVEHMRQVLAALGRPVSRSLTTRIWINEERSADVKNKNRN